MSKTLDSFQNTTVKDYDQRQRYFTSLMYGALAAYTRSTQPGSLLAQSPQVISPSEILHSNSVMHALRVLPDSKLLDFME